MQWKQRATLTCLCLYSNRQATIWVDMIAEDLFAAVRDKSKTKDPIFRLMTMLNLIFLEVLNKLKLILTHLQYTKTPLAGNKLVV